MHPVICQIGGFSVYSYGLMLALAFFTALFLTEAQAKKEGINPEIIFNLFLIAFIFGVIGARLLYISQNLSYYIKYPLEAFMLQHGGLSLFGGLILGSACGACYLKFKKAPLYKILDLSVPYLVLAQSIGRIGCLLNGCCFGRPSLYGLYFSVQRDFLLPTQIYSSLLLLLIFFFLKKLGDKPHLAGEIFSFYLILYSLKRFFIEFLRADNPEIILGFTVFHLFSIAVFLFACLNLIFIRKAAKK